MNARMNGAGRRGRSNMFSAQEQLYQNAHFTMVRVVCGTDSLS